MRLRPPPSWFRVDLVPEVVLTRTRNYVLSPSRITMAWYTLYTVQCVVICRRSLSMARQESWNQSRFSYDQQVCTYGAILPHYCTLAPPSWMCESWGTLLLRYSVIMLCDYDNGASVRPLKEANLLHYSPYWKDYSSSASIHFHSSLVSHQFHIRIIPVHIDLPTQCLPNQSLLLGPVRQVQFR